MDRQGRAPPPTPAPGADHSIFSAHAPPFLPSQNRALDFLAGSDGNEGLMDRTVPRGFLLLSGDCTPAANYRDVPPRPPTPCHPPWGSRGRFWTLPPLRGWGGAALLGFPLILITWPHSQKNNKHHAPLVPHLLLPRVSPTTPLPSHLGREKFFLFISQPGPWSLVPCLKACAAPRNLQLPTLGPQTIRCL